jgi:hypothetical protein
MNMRQFALALAASLGAAQALAGTLGAFDFSTAPGATTTVAPISPQVTYAKPTEVLKTFAAFNVGSGPYLLLNNSGNTLNNITITFTATVTDGAETLKLFDPATYLAGLPAGCTYPTGAAPSVTITCKLRQYKAGDSFPAFTVFYEAPAKVTNGVADEPNTDSVRLDIRVVYAEGTNGGNPRPNSVVNVTDGGVVTLGTENPTLVKSAVPLAGSTLFTGVGVTTLGAVATTSDPWTTTVIVPSNFTAPTGTYTVATIDEPPSDVPLASDLFTKESTKLTIPGAFASLTILLRRDVSTIAPKANIGSARVYYSANTDGTDLGIELFACTPAGPSPGVPCIKSRTEYTKQVVRQRRLSSAWEGDWEFEILALDNGRYSQ